MPRQPITPSSMSDSLIHSTLLWWSINLSHPTLPNSLYLYLFIGRQFGQCLRRPTWSMRPCINLSRRLQFFSPTSTHFYCRDGLNLVKLSLSLPWNIFVNFVWILSLINLISVENFCDIQLHALIDTWLLLLSNWQGFLKRGWLCRKNSGFQYKINIKKFFPKNFQEQPDTK